MISPTASGSPSRMPTVSSRPSMNRSSITCESKRPASSIAGSSSGGVRTSVSPTVEPCPFGFTINGKPSHCAAAELEIGAINQSGVGTPAATNSRFATSLSQPSALPSLPEPVYGMPARSSRACTVPSSPLPPCIARNTRSTSARSGADTTVGKLETDFWSGGRLSILPVNKRRSSAASSRPRPESYATTWCPRLRKAPTTCEALAIETSRSMLSPPNNTAIFKAPDLAEAKLAIVLERFGRFRERALVSCRYILPARGIESAEGDMRSIWRLTLVSLAAAAIVSGCEGGSSDEPQPITFTPGPAPAGTGFVAMYAPPVDNVPYPNDIYFNPTTARLNVPVKVTSPLANALNTLDGFSTTAVISAPFNGPLDPASLIPWNPLSMAPTAASIVVLNATAGTPLIPGTDYTVRISAAAGSGGGILEIVPLKPLAPRTRYAFIVTNGVRSTGGVPAGADLVFGAVRDTYLAGGTSVPGQPALNPLFLVIPPLLEAARAIGISPSN